MRAAHFSHLRSTLLHITRNGYASIIAIAVACFTLLGTASAAGGDNTYIVLCYHSIPERYHGDPASISASRFVEQLEWLREQGYTAISLDQVLKAKSGKIKLPAKSFMVTVDDGYEDFYTNIFPLLKLYKIPAVIALVGKWTEEGRPLKNETDHHFLKQRFLNWAQLEEMTRSGLVEVASHSYDLHYGILGNPQGNTQPAAVTLQYQSTRNQYETLDQRRTRTRADLERNSKLIAHHLGKRPRVMVWPYGAYDKIGVEEAARAGMPINFTLDVGRASVANTETIPRVLINKEMPLSTFSYIIQYAHLQYNTEPIHAIRVNLDRVYDRDPEKENKNLGKLIERVRELGLNTIVLQPFVTPGHSGLIEEVYFPSSVLPMRADLLNRVAWQLRSRLGVAVYILAPVTRLSVPLNGGPRQLDISTEQDRKQLFKLYKELSSHNPIHGIIFTEAPSSSAEMNIQQGLLKQIRQYRSFQRPLHDSEISSFEFRLKYGWNFQTAEQGHPFAVIDVPDNLRSGDIREFTQRLTSNNATLLSLATTDLDDDRLQLLIHRIHLLQDNGINNFLLDDDGFLDDPAKVNSLRSVLSLKNNPYLEVGQ